MGGESRTLLSRALEIAPDSANTNYAYGLALIRLGSHQEAIKYIKKATEQEDARPRHTYVYAIALDSMGNTSGAIKVINETSERWPNNLDLARLQVAYMDKTGETTGIHRYLSLLVSVVSNDPQVQAWIKKYNGLKK